MAYKNFRSRDEMKASGWVFSGQQSECRDCGGSIEWSKSPKKKNVPMDPGSVTIHFTTCTSANTNGPGKPRPSTTPQSRAAAQPEGDAGLLQVSIVELTTAIRSLIRVLMDRPVIDDADIPE